MAVEVLKDEQEKWKEYFEDFQEDPSEVLNPQPGFRYKTVNATAAGRLDVWKRRGYEIVRAPKRNDPNAARLVGATTGIEGGQQLGDNVLMRAPVEIFEKRVRRRLAKEMFQTTGNLEQTAENLNRIARNELHVAAHRDVVVVKTPAELEQEQADAERMARTQMVS